MSKSSYNSKSNGRRFNPSAKQRKSVPEPAQEAFGDDMTWEYPSSHLTQIVEVMATERKREALNYAINICLDHKYAISSKLFNARVTEWHLHGTEDEKDAIAKEWGDGLKELEAVTRALEQLFEIYDELF